MRFPSVEDPSSGIRQNDYTCTEGRYNHAALLPIVFGGELALALVNSDLVHRFDPELLKIFSHLMKGYTSKVLGGTGEKLDLF